MATPGDGLLTTIIGSANASTTKSIIASIESFTAFLDSTVIDAFDGEVAPALGDALGHPHHVAPVLAVRRARTQSSMSSGCSSRRKAPDPNPPTLGYRTCARMPSRSMCSRRALAS